MTDLGPITPVHCPEPGCHWSAHGIPDQYAEARARRLAEHQAEEHAHATVTSHAYEGDGDPCRAEAYGQTCGAPRHAHELDEGSSAPALLSPERESQLRALLTAGEALSPNAGWALLDELHRVRAERDKYATELDRQGLERWEDQPTRSVLEEVYAERQRQDARWGEQNHPDGTGGIEARRIAETARATCQAAAERGIVTWLHISDEEHCEALAETDPVKLRAELVQDAAVKVAWIEAIDRRAVRAPEEADR